MALFAKNEFTGHAGGTLSFKIECDDLSYEDIETLAWIVSRKLKFKEVHGIPRGGLRLAKALEQYCVPEGDIFIVDDVLTTGKSMEDMRQEVGGSPKGLVIFARNECPDWVQSIFNLSDWVGQ